MPNFLETYSANTLKMMWEQDPNRQPYVDSALFPAVKQRGLKFEYIKGKQGKPVALVSANFNTNVLYRDRIGIESLSGKLPYFKEAMRIDEELRQDLLSVREEFQAPIVERVLDDEMELMDGAEVTVARMRNQLIATGTVTISENGVNRQYDYGFDQSKQFKTLSKLWGTEGAKPLKDIQTHIQAYKKLRRRSPKYIYTNPNFLIQLGQDAEVIEYFSKLAIPNFYPSDVEVQEFVEKKFNVKIILQDKEYIEARDNTGTSVALYPTDRFTFLDTLNLGETVYGTTPEEADLLSGQSKASSVAIANTGVAITTWNEVDPVNVNTKVSEVVLPTCPNIESLYIVKFLNE